MTDITELAQSLKAAAEKRLRVSGFIFRKIPALSMT
ncbi:Uncharacterised protein [Klebsiella pneumoniae subsp. pneumoniae]|uniref:Uncharacterized protein n=1 Tax=Klebsiella pneumoniae subsp. pneumoniae TaxID=72407 RepID=A0A377ZDM7_KLEPN|nr:Uncharacterised protein [Klebsiella pneumoniae subsp. pneumoniae]